MKGMYNFWFRTPVGLETVALDEIKEKTEVLDYEIKHRSVFVMIKDDNFNPANLRTVDDAYRLLGIYNGIDNKKESLTSFFQYFKDTILQMIPTTDGSLRVTTSFLGKRNFNRFFVENNINDILENNTIATILSNEDGNSYVEGEQRIRLHLDDDSLYIGLALSDTPLHRRDWRTEKYNGQLDGVTAADMVRIIGDVGEKTIIDPFCGSGTLVIESALVNKNNIHIGFDLNSDAIEISGKNALNSKVKNVSFIKRDSFSEYDTYADNIIISNPPWDNKHLMEDDLFVDNFLKIIKISSKSVVIVPDEILNKIKEEDGINIEKEYQTRVRGFIVSILYINNK